VSTSTKPLVLVDGSSYLYRAFHALPALTTSRGEPTGAVYGVANMLRKLRETYDPEYMAVVFDAKGKTFRDALYAEYKANRPPMPPELEAQVEVLHELVRAMGYPVVEIPGVEADDVIGTLVRQARERGIEVVVSTGDKDLAQLVTDGVTLVNTMDDTTLDRASVEAKFGVPPERIVDFLALTGDKIDNIPGVPGVGPKTAAKWLRQYGSLQGVLEHADEIRGKVGERLREVADTLPLSRELARIRTDLELPLKLEDLRLREPDRERLRELLTRLEFRSWLKELDRSADDPPEAQRLSREGDYELVLDREALEAWRRRLDAAPVAALDTETTSLQYMDARVVGVSVSVEPGRAAYVPFGHDYPDAPAQLPEKVVWEILQPWLEDPARPKLGHNLKYDRNVLANHGIELRGIRHDTMLESYVLNSTASRHDLDTLSLKYLGHTPVAYSEVAGKGTAQVPFDQVSLEQAGPYAAEDADLALRLHRRLWPELEATESLRRVYEEIEIPLVPVLSRMERTGVLIDTEALRRQSEALAERLRQLEERAWRLAGRPFNLGSPKQLQEILFGELGLPVLRRTPKGQPSTAEDVLQELAVDYELPRVILEHRSLAKLRGTYTTKLPELVNPRTGRVHTSYHQAVAATGRLSSSDPNLQNIPIRTEEGRKIRQAFVAPEGWLILAADYSQIELRIMAHLSGDEGLLRAFREGLDIHRATAAEVFGVPPEAVTPEQRRAAKAINFGLIYGMSAFGLARQLGIDRESAQAYVDRYFARYPGVRAYMERTREQAREQGYVETLFGRRLYVPDIRSRNAQRRQYAERTAINAPMQGTAADIIKRAMIRVDAWLREEAAPARMIMQVHDELVFEVRREAAESLGARLRTLMEGAAELEVPLVVEVGWGENWDEAH
jgi:DNA polymerase-1